METQEVTTGRGCGWSGGGEKFLQDYRGKPLGKVQLKDCEGDGENI
jgi:hypothetical protein